MKKRSTMNVEYIRKHANEQLLNTADDMKEYREGIIHMLEHTLRETKNYRGFSYLTATEMRASNGDGVSVGIHLDVPEGERFLNADETRVQYN